MVMNIVSKKGTATESASMRLISRHLLAGSDLEPCLAAAPACAVASKSSSNWMATACSRNCLNLVIRNMPVGRLNICHPKIVKMGNIKAVA